MFCFWLKLEKNLIELLISIILRYYFSCLQPSLIDIILSSFFFYWWIFPIVWWILNAHITPISLFILSLWNNYKSSFINWYSSYMIITGERPSIHTKSTSFQTLHYRDTQVRVRSAFNFEHVGFHNANAHPSKISVRNVVRYWWLERRQSDCGYWSVRH